MAMDDDGRAATVSAAAPASPTEPVPAPPLSSPSRGTRDPLHTLHNRLLHFLSNASNETLGACAVGLAASTYLILGRIGLVLIGAVGGIALHARWESLGRPGTADSEAIAQEARRKRTELGIEVAKRALDWRDRRRRLDEGSREGSDYGTPSSRSSIDNKPAVDFSDLPPESREAVTRFTDAVVRDYVKWWYQPLLPDDNSFPAACRQTLTKFILAFTNHLARKRTADPVLDFLANSTSIIIVFLNEISTAMKASPRQDPLDAIRTYLQHQPESSLANVLNRDQQDKKLNIIADDVLHNFLEPASYDCLPVRAFLREVLSGLILKPVIESQAKTDSINGWIVSLLEDGESELMHAIDAGVDDAAAKLKGPAAAAAHQRHFSRAEEAMEEAMKEVERMNAMIAEEEASRRKENGTVDDDSKRKPSIISSASTTAIPQASPDSSEARKVPRRLRSASYLMDAEGNVIRSPKTSPTKSTTDFTARGEATGQAEVSLPASQSSVDLTPSTPPLPLEAAPVVVVAPLTLHNASVTIMDLGDGDEFIIIKKEPTQSDFLVQIEPASSRFRGWMVMKRYADFVKLQERLMTYARIGVPQFGVQHPEVPSWRGIARRTLCANLQSYLRDALKYEALAESEAMKKFLDKEAGIAKAGPQKNVLVQGGAALENVGKNFVNVLGQGGKGIAGGGKVVIGGVQGAFGAIAGGVGATTTAKKPVSSQSKTASKATPTTASPTRTSPETSDTDQQEKAPSLQRSSSADLNQLSASAQQDEASVPLSEQETLQLPPPPTEMSDEYGAEDAVAPAITTTTASGHTSRTNTPSGALTPTSSLLHSAESLPTAAAAAAAAATKPAKPRRHNSNFSSSISSNNNNSSSSSSSNNSNNEPLTTEETRVLVELMFAIVTELYALSPSAWTIRLSLLSAAKTFLLRPQNPQLESIRALVQQSVLDANFSDRGVAAHVDRLRQTSLPTGDEQQQRAALTPDESARLRRKARRLLVERGMPQALTSVVGQAASGEALGRVFDCLQDHDLARAFVFALVQQALRAASQ